MKSGRGLLSWAALFRKGRAGSSVVVSAVLNGRHEIFRAYALKIQRVREVVQAAR